MKKYSYALMFLILISSFFMFNVSCSRYLVKTESFSMTTQQYIYNSTKLFNLEGATDVVGVISVNFTSIVQYNSDFTFNYKFYNSSFQQYDVFGSFVRNDYKLFNSTYNNSAEISINVDISLKSDDCRLYLNYTSSQTIILSYTYTMTFLFNAKTSFNLLSAISSSITSIIFAIAPLIVSSYIDEKKWANLVNIVCLSVFSVISTRYLVVVVVYVVFLITRDEKE